MSSSSSSLPPPSKKVPRSPPPATSLTFSYTLPSTFGSNRSATQANPSSLPPPPYFPTTHSAPVSPISSVDHQSIGATSMSDMLANKRAQRYQFQGSTSVDLSRPADRMSPCTTTMTTTTITTTTTLMSTLFPSSSIITPNRRQHPHHSHSSHQHPHPHLSSPSSNTPPPPFLPPSAHGRHTSLLPLDPVPTPPPFPPEGYERRPRRSYASRSVYSSHTVASSAISRPSSSGSGMALSRRTSLSNPPLPRSPSLLPSSSLYEPRPRSSSGSFFSHDEALSWLADQDHATPNGKDNLIEWNIQKPQSPSLDPQIPSSSSPPPSTNAPYPSDSPDHFILESTTTTTTTTVTTSSPDSGDQLSLTQDPLNDPKEDFPASEYNSPLPTAPDSGFEEMKALFSSPWSSFSLDHKDHTEEEVIPGRDRSKSVRSRAFSSLPSPKIQGESQGTLLSSHPQSPPPDHNLPFPTDFPEGMVVHTGHLTHPNDPLDTKSPSETSPSPKVPISPVQLSGTTRQPSTSSTHTQKEGVERKLEAWLEPSAAELDNPSIYLTRILRKVPEEDIGKALSQPGPFFSRALGLYMTRMDFSAEPIDLSLRKLLSQVHLPKEAQQIDRILQVFADRYHQANPEMFPSSEVVYSLTFSLMLLHTDAHNPRVRRKMSKSAFIRHTMSMEGVDALAPQVLEVLYDNITRTPFVYASSPNQPRGTDKRSRVRARGQGHRPIPSYPLSPPQSDGLARSDGLRRNRWAGYGARPISWYGGSRRRPGVGGSGGGGWFRAMIRRCAKVVWGGGARARGDRGNRLLLAGRLPYAPQPTQYTYQGSGADARSRAQQYALRRAAFPLRVQGLSRIPRDRTRPGSMYVLHRGGMDERPSNKDGNWTTGRSGGRERGKALSTRPSLPNLFSVTKDTPARSVTDPLIQSGINQRPLPLSLSPHMIRGNEESIRCTKEGILWKKEDVMEGGRRVTWVGGGRAWRPVWTILTGSHLLFFTDIAWFQEARRRAQEAHMVSSQSSQGNWLLRPAYHWPLQGEGMGDGREASAPRPSEVLSLHGAVSVRDHGYRRKPFTWRLCAVPTGRQLLLRAPSAEAMGEWMDFSNAASAFTTLGIHPRGDTAPCSPVSPDMGGPPDTLAFPDSNPIVQLPPKGLKRRNGTRKSTISFQEPIHSPESGIGREKREEEEEEKEGEEARPPKSPEKSSLVLQKASSSESSGGSQKVPGSPGLSVATPSLTLSPSNSTLESLDPSLPSPALPPLPALPALLGSPERTRQNVLEEALMSIAKDREGLQEQIKKDLRLYRQLAVLLPCRRSTRSRALSAGRACGERLRARYLELQQLECYEGVLIGELEADAAGVGPGRNRRTMETVLHERRNQRRSRWSMMRDQRLSVGPGLGSMMVEGWSGTKTLGIPNEEKPQEQSLSLSRERRKTQTIDEEMSSFVRALAKELGEEM